MCGCKMKVVGCQQSGSLTANDHLKPHSNHLPSSRFPASKPSQISPCSACSLHCREKAHIYGKSCAERPAKCMQMFHIDSISRHMEAAHHTVSLSTLKPSNWSFWKREKLWQSFSSTFSILSFILKVSSLMFFCIFLPFVLFFLDFFVFLFFDPALDSSQQYF